MAAPKRVRTTRASRSGEAKALAAANSSKGKKEKVNNQVLMDEATHEKLYSEVPKYKLITISILCDRLRLNGSLARKALNKLKEEGLIKPVVCHGQQVIYTRAGGAA